MLSTNDRSERRALCVSSASEFELVLLRTAKLSFRISAGHHEYLSSYCYQHGMHRRYSRSSKYAVSVRRPASFC
jgi:hypothetical protein